jgi:polar amino acid transport system permease protein
MNFDVITSYIPLYTEAFFLTIRIGWTGIGLALLIGVFVAFAQHFRVPVLARIAGIYVELFRNTPLLCQLFFLYFGLPKIGITIPAETCGTLGLGLLGGSYMAEVFRSGLGSIPVTQEEGALALGLTRRQMFTYVVFPEALSLSVPGIVGNMIFLLKETSVFSAISLMDLMFTAKDLIGLYYNTTEALFLLVIFYIIMLLPVSVLGSILENKVKIRTYGA